MPSPQLDRDKLAKLLGLLSSEHAGERASAGAIADRLVREAGLTWSAVVAGFTSSGGRQKPGQREEQAQRARDEQAQAAREAQEREESEERERKAQEHREREARWARKREEQARRAREEQTKREHEERAQREREAQVKTNPWYQTGDQVQSEGPARKQRKAEDQAKHDREAQEQRAGFGGRRRPRPDHAADWRYAHLADEHGHLRWIFRQAPLPWIARKALAYGVMALLLLGALCAWLRDLWLLGWGLFMVFGPPGSFVFGGLMALLAVVPWVIGRLALWPLRGFIRELREEAAERRRSAT